MLSILSFFLQFSPTTLKQKGMVCTIAPSCQELFKVLSSYKNSNFILFWIIQGHKKIREQGRVLLIMEQMIMMTKTLKLIFWGTKVHKSKCADQSQPNLSPMAPKFMQKIVGCLPSARAPLTDIFSETYLIVFNLEKHFLLSLVVTISVTNQIFFI